jgi:ribosomal protein S18 acetylase RimI-like enzyme
MPADLIIRKAKSDDLPVLKGFEQELILAERPFDPALKEGTIHYYNLELMIDDPNTELIVVQVGDQLVGSGYALIKNEKPYIRNKQYAYLGFMYVVSAFRGQGINKMIIDTLIRWSHSRKIEEIRLEVYADNISAIRAYEKAGFVLHKVEMQLRHQ